jgi:hypothetical protein
LQICNESLALISVSLLKNAGIPNPSERLRDLARAVEQIGRGRTNPEQTSIKKMSVANEMRRLAREIEQ